MISLGIDPGTATLGYGLVRELPDGSLQMVDYGVIRTAAGTPMAERLQTIYTELRGIIAAHRPDRAGVEELFFARNVSTAITVAQARGVVLLALQEAGLSIAEHKPNAVKMAVCGYGGADKAQMQDMVRLLLELEETPRPDDAADALAVAIADLHSYRLRSLELA
ncbi:MAG: crossover junction endodeoxyribonuclease RuvC [Chloroflexi bacterium]|nr:crossover junction endodeoxyribonuclease RuvC [Chloroflexota bacterium]MCY3581749.1 crossover junction endodeoxyribonuclease RuvC [Chloroflexota bacterium]MXX51314.1 crossover junction endodeoxyribonuclease RuvC [Chloroflexota bacterium]MXX82826.1 crossover junction endodeoxyribonuclease RuvC [Chloroflexota bacterium]MYA94510.1 crossover junction endodeoxyribonuclease RuvC [Chloroflexota bacterium]